MEFLKIINCSLMSSGIIPTDEQKITTVGLWLKSNSPAEEWFNDAATPKNKYTDFKHSFKQWFPNVEKMKKTKLELERELAGMRIKVENLGKTEKYRGEDVYTHIVFAEKVLDLAKQAKIERTANLALAESQDNLPGVLQEKIPKNQADWATFTNAIKAVELGHIREGVQRYKEETAKEEKVQVQLSLLEQCTADNTVILNSPTKPIHNHLNKTTISQPLPIRANPFVGRAGGQGNLFATPTRHPVFAAQPKPAQQHPLEDKIKTIRDSIV